MRGGISLALYLLRPGWHIAKVTLQESVQPNRKEEGCSASSQLPAPRCSWDGSAIIVEVWN
jgi:hypothetical protein